MGGDLAAPVVEGALAGGARHDRGEDPGWRVSVAEGPSGSFDPRRSNRVEDHVLHVRGLFHAKPRRHRQQVPNLEIPLGFLYWEFEEVTLSEWF